MDARYDRATRSLFLAFTPLEADEAAVLMQLVWEDEWQKGTTVPDYSDDFFKQIAVSREKIPVELEFEFQEFAIVFLEEACARLLINDATIAELKKFLVELRQTVH
ncbi:MAG: hypothetical protein A2937_03765 [Candidatus Yonathbacteria bacterium RIFCSPLOWO2_01_FULL_47_33b]|uniref:Uncharacterized protein n=1 Tax=Candidatus Yonathbacteria bacterium RIFCSPLOWO2_01_FULL_47_33b TaxID=1802727 RepID=A0A1G2SFI4_9BACT|nr:MAG: hypothetical protein A2937_03765 [Candidatus Yonathbacteria bacterium RIFCSPLOWO2_01_FULL_47_33b]